MESLSIVKTARKKQSPDEWFLGNCSVPYSSLILYGLLAHLPPFKIFPIKNWANFCLLLTLKRTSFQDHENMGQYIATLHMMKLDS